MSARPASSWLRPMSDTSIPSAAPSPAFRWAGVLLLVAIASSALVFCLVAAGLGFQDAAMALECGTLAFGRLPGVHPAALIPILLGGFGLGFFTFAGGDLRGGTRVRGLCVCFLALGLCSASLESFQHRTRDYRKACPGVGPDAELTARVGSVRVSRLWVTTRSISPFSISPGCVFLP
jgi:hypothetical protein